MTDLNLRSLEMAAYVVRVARGRKFRPFFPPPRSPGLVGASPGAPSVSPPVVGRGRDTLYLSSHSTLPSSDVVPSPGASSGGATHRNYPQTAVEPRPGLPVGSVPAEAVSLPVRPPRTLPLIFVAERCPEARRMLGLEDEFLHVSASPHSTVHRPFQVVTPFICPIRQHRPPPGFEGRYRFNNLQ